MLTDEIIQSAVHGDKVVRLYDGASLYLEVMPSGAKYWRYKYRFGGVEKRISCGVYPETSILDARAARDQARKQVKDGKDPAAQRKSDRYAQRLSRHARLETVALQWLNHRSGAWKEGTRQAIEATLRNDVFPKLGSRLMNEVQPRDIRDLVQAVEKRGASETAGRIFQRVRAIYRYALAHELANTDPTYALKPSEILKPRKTKHRSSLPEADMPMFLRRLDRYDGDRSTRYALELLLLTATRPGELRGARWNEFDEPAALWRIPAVRMKMGTDHLVPLSRQALGVLQTMRTLSGLDELVFPSPFYPGKLLSDNTLNSALARLGYKGIATAHGFRTLFSTCANEAGWSSDVIEKQLAHEERNEVRAAYNRAQWLSDRQELMQWWADRLDQMRTGLVTSSGMSRAVVRVSKDVSDRLPPQYPPADANGDNVQDAPTFPAAPPSYVAPQSALPDPIDVLRALVAVFDQQSSRKRD